MMNNSAASRPSSLLVRLLLLACLTLGCSQAPAPPEEEKHPAPVKAVAPEMKALAEWTELIGSTQPLPDRAARLTASVEGRINSVLGDGKLKEGQKVEAEQVIVQPAASVGQATL